MNYMQSFNNLSSFWDEYAGITIFIVGIFYILSSIATKGLLQKTRHRSWRSWLPIYNFFLLSKVAMGTGWYIVWALIPGVNIVAYVLFNIRLSKSFGHSTNFALGLIFLNTIFLFVLALDTSYYKGPGGTIKRQHLYIDRSC